VTICACQWCVKRRSSSWPFPFLSFAFFLSALTRAIYDLRFAPNYSPLSLSFVLTVLHFVLVSLILSFLRRRFIAPIHILFGIFLSFSFCTLRCTFFLPLLISHAGASSLPPPYLFVLSFHLYNHCSPAPQPYWRRLGDLAATTRGLSFSPRSFVTLFFFHLRISHVAVSLLSPSGHVCYLLILSSSILSLGCQDPYSLATVATSAPILVALGVLSLHRIIIFRSLLDHFRSHTTFNGSTLSHFKLHTSLLLLSSVVGLSCSRGWGWLFSFRSLVDHIQISIRSRSIGWDSSPIQSDFKLHVLAPLVYSPLSFHFLIHCLHCTRRRSSLSPFTSDARRHEREREGVRLYGAAPTLLFTSDPADLFNSFIN